MATLKEDSHSWKSTGIKHRDHRHDHGDGYIETPHKKKSKGKPRKKAKGCPGNDGKAHVYIWVLAAYADEFLPTPWWEKYFRLTDSYYYEYERKVCCGCKKQAPGRSFRRKNS